MNNQLVINNNLIAYSDFGIGENAVIFLHGWRSNKEVWQQVTDKLISLSAYKLYTVDLPGFGKSQTPEIPMTVGDYAEVVKGFIEKLELKNVIIVGHSFGGRIGIKLAAKYPSLIKKLVLVDAAGFAMDSSKKITMNFAAKIAKPFFKPKFMQGLRKSIYKQIGAEDYVATPNLQKTFVNITGEDLTEDLKKIICPTLIITGEDDKETPVEFGKRMQSLIHNSRFIILANAGHFSFLDQSDEFLRVIENFTKQ